MLLLKFDEFRRKFHFSFTTTATTKKKPMQCLSNNMTSCRVNGELDFCLLDCLPESLFLLTFVLRPPPNFRLTFHAFECHFSEGTNRLKFYLLNPVTHTHQLNSIGAFSMASNLSLESIHQFFSQELSCYLL